MSAAMAADVKRSVRSYALFITCTNVTHEAVMRATSWGDDATSVGSTFPVRLCFDAPGWKVGCLRGGASLLEDMTTCSALLLLLWSLP